MKKIGGRMLKALTSSRKAEEGGLKSNMYSFPNQKEKPSRESTVDRGKDKQKAMKIVARLRKRKEERQPIRKGYSSVETREL